MTRPSHSNPPPIELLERARLALQSLQYRERAASYRAAAATLQAAMLEAENGHPRQLQQWLDLESPRLEGDFRDSPSELSEGSFRIDPAHAELPQIGYVLQSQTSIDVRCSPWGQMEKATAARLAARTWEASEPVATEPDEFAEMQSAESDAKYALMESIDESLSADKGLMPKELRVAIECIDRDSASRSSQPWWRVPHVWVSLLVHLALIVCLGLVAISAASQPKLLSIVSSPSEAENVLMETPMEMISELESSPEPLQSTSMPSLSELRADISIEDLAIINGTEVSTAVQPIVSSEIANSVSEQAQSAMGSKMLAGAEFFGAKATGNTFVYIVDSSPSMRRDGAFEAARKEIVRSLSSMKPKQRYFISFFGKEIDPMVFENGVSERYPVYAKPENLTKTIDWLSRVQVQKEGLPPNNALTEAIAMQPDGIFLLFDGDTKVDVAKHLRRVNRSDDLLSGGLPKVPIHVIHFFQEEFQMQMKRIADENGGTYRFIPRPARTPKSNR